MSLFARIHWGRLLIAGVAVAGLSQLLDDGEPAAVTAAGDNLQSNRPWIDHIPASDRDLVTHLLFLNKDGQRIGAVGRASAWRQHIELFQWSGGEGSVKLTFPQDNKKADVKVAVSRCEAPEPLNLCLKVGEGRGSATFYSSTDWNLQTPDLAAVQGLLPIDPDAEPAAVLDLDTLLK